VGRVVWESHCESCGAAATRQSSHYKDGECKKMATFLKKGGKASLESVVRIPSRLYNCAKIIVPQPKKLFFSAVLLPT
jgi:hypothetical protein